MARKELAVDCVAEAYLALLAERGIEYLFANAGTDFAPLVEAFAKAARTGTAAPQPLLIDLDELPAFEQVCAAAGGYGERVEDPAALPAALERAIRAVTVEKRQALLNVICSGPGA
jgi:thiamine pyrophosphate-dependent acetolactate synthase large subunit-like protein